MNIKNILFIQDTPPCVRTIKIATVLSGKGVNIHLMYNGKYSANNINEIFTSLNKLKRSIGMQWRLNGFSFYNYPTAIELEYHYPLDKFERIINDEIIPYGKEGRTYVKILFDF